MAQMINRDPVHNRGLATEESFREKKKLRGLLPANVRSYETQEAAALAELRALSEPLSKYKYLQSLQNTDERL